MDSLTRARIQLIEINPFYGTFLQYCLFSWNLAVGTACVGVDKAGRIQLIISPKFWEELTQEMRVGLLMHEVLHLCLAHLPRGKNLDRKLSNIAQDIALNQYIPSRLRGADWLMPETYGLPKGQSYEFYYLELLNDPKKNSKAQSGSGQTTDNHSSVTEFTGEDDGVMSEAFGSGLPPDIAQSVINEAIKKTAGAVGRGNIPLPVLSALNEQEKRKAQVKWGSLLKNFLGKTLSKDYQDTRNKPNRRMGFSAPGKKRLEQPKVIIAVDNSGSMRASDISLVMQEAKQILKDLSERTEVLYFDVVIAHKETLSKISEVKRYANGGTDFNCVVKHANSQRADLLIMLTDGDGGLEIKPSCPVIWVMPKGSPELQYPGMKIVI